MDVNAISHRQVNVGKYKDVQPFVGISAKQIKYIYIFCQLRINTNSAVKLWYILMKCFNETHSDGSSVYTA